MSWNRIRGHDAQIEALDRVLKRGRLAHAYVFTGPSGIGKRLFAHELAKALLCENKSSDRLEACDQCTACHLVDARTHPDFFSFSRPEDRLEFPIELSQELCHSLALKPARGKHKLVILEDADDLNEESSNCLLKTLEEPPPGSVLILIATAPERLLTTIVSRCQIVRFQPLPAEAIAEIVREHGTENIEHLDRLVRLSNGSPGMALELADPALWEFRQTLLEGLAANRPDSVSLGKQWTQFLEESGKDAAAHRRRAALILRMLIEFFNDVLRVSVGEQPRFADPGDLPFLQKLGQRVDPHRCIQILDRCLDADMHIDRRVQLVLAVEALVHELVDGFQAPVSSR